MTKRLFSVLTKQAFFYQKTKSPEPKPRAFFTKIIAAIGQPDEP